MPTNAPWLSLRTEPIIHIYMPKAKGVRVGILALKKKSSVK